MTITAVMRPELDAERIRLATLGKQVFVAPDFFIDHFVRYPSSYSHLKTEFDRVIAQGGGNVLGTEQYIAKGGNAVNTAIALGHFQIKTNLFTVTDALGYYLLKLFIGDLPIDISSVRTDGVSSITTAFEVKTGKGKLTNIMVSASGSLLTIDAEHLSDEVLELAKDSDAVCFFNWSQTKKGTDIAEALFKAVKEKGKGLTFFDPGDPSYKKEEIPLFAKRMFYRGLVDVVSMNENEFSRFWRALGVGTKKRSELVGKKDLLLLSDKLSCRVDYHTTEFSATAYEGQCDMMPCFRIEPVRATGSGDTWNAGDILGYLSGLQGENRLLLANATAASYISNPLPRPPSLTEAIEFASSKPLKRISMH